jgi:hypothetical protein
MARGISVLETAALVPEYPLDGCPDGGGRQERGDSCALAYGKEVEEDNMLTGIGKRWCHVLDRVRVEIGFDGGRSTCKNAFASTERTLKSMGRLASTPLMLTSRSKRQERKKYSTHSVKSPVSSDGESANRQRPARQLQDPGVSRMRTIRSPKVT